MKKPNKTLRTLGVGRMNLKYTAHALTLFAVFWSFPSGFVILLLVLAHQDRVSSGSSLSFTSTAIAGACMVVVIVGLHLWSILGAIYYWRTERKRKVTVLH